MPSNELPPAWTVTTEVEVIPSPIDINMTEPRSVFARRSTRVLNSLDQLVAASGDEADAVNQALAICQSTMVPYDSLTWPHP